jgi:hypothetical protein
VQRRLHLGDLAAGFLDLQIGRFDLPISGFLCLGKFM